MSDSSDESVGYGRPPTANRFKAGQSGNPRGRPKGSRNVATLVDEELSRKIDVTVDGHRQRVSKSKVVARRLVDRALKGDLRSITTVMGIQNGPAGRGGGRAGDQAATPREVTQAQDEAILKAYVDRLRSEGAAS